MSKTSNFMENELKRTIEIQQRILAARLQARRYADFQSRPQSLFTDSSLSDIRQQFNSENPTSEEVSNEYVRRIDLDSANIRVAAQIADRQQREAERANRMLPLAPRNLTLCFNTMAVANSQAAQSAAMDTEEGNTPPSVIRITSSLK